MDKLYAMGYKISYISGYEFLIPFIKILDNRKCHNDRKLGQW